LFDIFLFILTNFWAYYDILARVHPTLQKTVNKNERFAFQNRGKRLQEGAHINLSLLALGNCITALARGGDVRHINFRDSKLTRLLKGALTGGGSKLSCVMIAHVSPGSVTREESRTTLLYAERAARISLAAAQNSRPAGYMAAQATIRAEKKRLRAEIEMMRARLDVER